MILQGALSGHAATFNGTPVAGAGGGTLTLGLDLFDYGTTATADAGTIFYPYPLSARVLTLSDLPASQLGILQSGSAQISAATVGCGRLR